MIKIAICDDEIIFLSRFRKFITTICNTMKLSVEIFDYSRSDVLIYHHKLSNFDIIFLDIDMPGISGFNTAQQIREISIDTPIIFVTSRDDLVYSSFEYQPFHFIRKYPDINLYGCIEHVMKKLISYFGQFKTISVNNVETGLINVPAREILYIKSEKHYLFYYLSKGMINPLKERNSISTILKELDTYGIIKIHQRYLANLSHIVKLDTMLNEITFTDGSIAPISKQYRSTVIERYMVYTRR